MIDKSHAADAFVVGEQGTYTIGVTNDGPSPSVGTADDPVTVTDTLPAGLAPASVSATGWDCTTVDQTVTCEFVGEVASGSSFPAIAITVDVGTAAEGGVTNTATVTPGVTHDPDPTDDEDEDPTDITPSADLTITKTVDDDTVDAGGTATYRLVVGNDGPSAAEGPIVVTDTLPLGLVPDTAGGTGWSCTVAGQVITCETAGPLADGATLPEIVATATVGATAELELVNTATVTSETPDPDETDNTDDAEVNARRVANLVIDKSHAADAFVVGEQGTYTIGGGQRRPVAERRHGGRSGHGDRHPPGRPDPGVGVGPGLGLHHRRPDGHLRVRR